MHSIKRKEIKMGDPIKELVSQISQRNDPMVLRLVQELHQCQSTAGNLKANLEFMSAMCDLMAEEISNLRTKGIGPDVASATPKKITEEFTIKTYGKLKHGET